MFVISTKAWTLILRLFIFRYVKLYMLMNLKKKKKRIIKLDSLFAWRWSCPLAPRILIFVIMIFCNYFDFFTWFREVHTFFRETNFARACKFLLKHSLKHKQFIWYQFKSNLVSKIVINSLPFIKIWCILMNSVFCFIIF